MSLRAVGDTTAWSSQIPPSVALDGAVGSMVTAARGDHTHAARIQRMIGTTDVNGLCTVTFARIFTVQPVIACLYQESVNNQPIVSKVQSYQTDVNGNYTGVILQCYRAQTLPSVLTLLTQLLSFNIFGAPPPSGISIHIFAADPTQ